MAASIWRMNEFCRTISGILLLCALLFSSEVTCEDAENATHTVDPNNVTSDAAARANAGPQSSTFQTNETSGDSPASANATEVDALNKSNNQDVGTSVDTNGTFSNNTTPIHPIVPEVECVGKGEIKSGVKVKVTETKDCSGVTNEIPPSSGSSVFVGILVTGLLAALAIIVGYFKCQRRPDTKGAKLAEEAYPVDQENQGNTLASEAPLNPPPETQEKPSVNGESPEAVKTETSPPTNGHSTAKTADTEL